MGPLLQTEEICEKVPGARELVSWYGHWPSFHDAEVLSIELQRSELSRVRVHAFTMTDAVDSSGHYVTEKHAVVTFQLSDIQDTSLEGFNHQNVLSEVSILESKDSLTLPLYNIYVVGGTLIAKHISVEFKPGIPPGSVYSQH